MKQYNEPLIDLDFFIHQDYSLNNLSYEEWIKGLDQDPIFFQGLKYHPDWIHRPETNDLLHKAVRSHHLPRVTALIHAGFPLNSMDVFGFTPLMHAASMGDLPLTQLLIESGADVNVSNPRGYNPLTIAASENSPIVQALIQAGANVHHRTTFDETPLIIALSSDRSSFDLIQTLLEAGADVNDISRDGERDSSLIKAISHPDPSVFNLIFQHLQQSDLIHQANSKGVTPLQKAASHSLEKFKLLMNAGADLQTKDHRDSTVLMNLIKAFHHDDELHDLLTLLKPHISVNDHDIDGWTALMMAALTNDDQTILFLKQAGADVNLQNKEGHTALTVSTQLNYFQSFSALLSLPETHINAQTHQGWTALMFAVIKKNTTMIEALFSKEVDPFLMNDRQETALSLAYKHGDPSVIQTMKRCLAEYENRQLQQLQQHLSHAPVVQKNLRL